MACPKSLYQENLKLRSGETTCLATQNMVPGLAAASSPSIYLFWLHWVFVAARGIALVAVSAGCSLLQHPGFSLQVGSLVVEQGL